MEQNNPLEHQQPKESPVVSGSSSGYIDDWQDQMTVAAGVDDYSDRDIIKKNPEYVSPEEFKAVEQFLIQELNMSAIQAATLYAPYILAVIKYHRLNKSGSSSETCPTCGDGRERIKWKLCPDIFHHLSNKPPTEDDLRFVASYQRDNVHYIDRGSSSGSEEQKEWKTVNERPTVNCTVAVRTKNHTTEIMSYHAMPEEKREFHKWMFGKWMKQTHLVELWTFLFVHPPSPPKQ